MVGVEHARPFRRLAEFRPTAAGSSVLDPYNSLERLSTRIRERALSGSAYNVIVCAAQADRRLDWLSSSRRLSDSPISPTCPLRFALCFRWAPEVERRPRLRCMAAIS